MQEATLSNGQLAAREFNWEEQEMHAADVHTMTADPGSAWVVEEGLLRDVTPICYSLLRGKRLDNSGLYQPMTDKEIDRVWVTVLEAALVEGTL